MLSKTVSRDAAHFRYVKILFIIFIFNYRLCFLSIIACACLYVSRQPQSDERQKLPPDIAGPTKDPKAFCRRSDFAALSKHSPPIAACR
jgi:hypothetical protein